MARVALCRRLVSLALVALFPSVTAAQTAHSAINDPDRFAWELFAEINAPIPDDAEGRVVWERWALARDVYANPNKPPSWETLTATKRTVRALEPLPLQQLLLLRGGVTDVSSASSKLFGPFFDLPAAQNEGNETRMNRTTFQFVVDNDLYYLEGQEEFFDHDTPIAFPINAREVKAQWRKIDPSDAGFYHTAIVQNGAGAAETWGLTALHITTKDLPNWFWATWEHKSNPRRELLVPSRDRAGLPDALRGTKWEHYVLRGTQTDFTDAMGRPTLLASSQIENGFELSSSCITCHARASIGSRKAAAPNRIPVFESDAPVVGSVGPPKPEWFFRDGARQYLQTDFVWSLFRARSRRP